MDLSKGGYKIIDISSLPLSEVTEATNISDGKILKQLLSLSEYALHPDRKLKPIYLRSIDEDGVENVAMAELDRNSGSMRILALINLMLLAISVSYSVDADTQEVSIDTASYVCVKDETRMADVVTDLVEGGTLDNAKPVYCHPINITFRNNDDWSLATIKGQLGCLIFNNDPTPFTITTFKQWCDDLRQLVGDTIAIVCTGGFQISAGTYSDGKMTIASRLYEVTQNSLQVAGMSVDGASNIITEWTTIANNIRTFSDGVNKIN